MGIELELSVLLLMQLLGTELFGRFEIETPAWRRVLKWLFVIGGTLGLYPLIGHWSLMFPLGLGALGSTFHFIWCRRQGIHPLRATPKRKYYDLRGWEWSE